MCSSSPQERERMSQIPYASAIGSNMYAMICTRPDLSYALSMTSRYQANLGEEQLSIKGYNDASFQTDKDDSRSQSGFIFCLNGGAVSWKSSKQDTVADSTTEAEYIAATEVAKEAVWIKKFVTELGVVPSISDAMELYCDNNGAIAQAKEPRSHQRSKHILRRFHLIREIIDRGDVEICKVHTDDNIPDPLTKPLTKQKHDRHTESLGIRYDYPRNPNKVPARTPTNVSNAPSNRNRGPHLANSGNQSRGKGIGLQSATTAQESPAPARAYHIKGREDEESPDFIAGTIEVNSSPAYALIDSGSTHSFLCSTQLEELRLVPENANTSLLVSNPLGRTVPINYLCKQCPITIRGISFPIDLYVIPSCEFDVILGLDWLEKHEAWVDCQNRRLYLRGLGKELILLIDKKPTSIFVVMTLQDECDIGLPKIPVISEYVDVFPEELLGLPLTREVEFRIEI
ncbi:hypothetical protein V6N12_050640 [Hibiscus sabdariffa]|uniref:Polyprotein n=1 Tax=Hibiscus sabdariffa TaxID=183260 RepID=A0ABR2GCZ3_9ROSI